MDRSGLDYKIFKKKLMMILRGRPLKGYDEFDLAIKTGVVDQHNFPESLNYTVKGIPLDNHESS